MRNTQQAGQFPVVNRFLFKTDDREFSVNTDNRRISPTCAALMCPTTCRSANFGHPSLIPSSVLNKMTVSQILHHFETMRVNIDLSFDFSNTYLYRVRCAINDVMYHRVTGCLHIIRYRKKKTNNHQSLVVKGDAKKSVQQKFEDEKVNRLWQSPPLHLVKKVCTIA